MMKVGGKVYSRWNRGIYLYSSFIALWNKALKYLFHSSMLQKRNFERKWVCTVIQCSVQFNRSVVSDSLQPHELQHARPPCPSPTPRVHSNSGPLSLWCHPAISSSVVPFSSCPQSLPASESTLHMRSSSVVTLIQWQPTPVLLSGESHGRRSLVGCSPWGHWELDTTEWLNFHFSFSCIGEENGNPLQYSCLENPRDGGVYWAAIYGVAQSWTWLKRLSSSSNATYWAPAIYQILF